MATTPEYQAQHYQRNKARKHADRKARIVADPAFYRRRYLANREHTLAITAARHAADPTKRLLVAARNRAKRKGITCTIVATDIMVPSTCPVLGIPLVVGCGVLHPGSPTLDRFDNTKGYVPGNVVVISFRANALKSDGSAEELRRVADYASNLLGH